MKLPIELQITGFARGRSGPGSIRSFRDAITLDVLEIHAHEAPIALQWEDDFGDRFETRWYDGSHWIAFDRMSDPVDQARFSAADIKDMAARPGDRRLDDLFSGYFKKGHLDIPALDRSKFVEFDDATREEAHASARQWATNCIVVGETFYTRCPEPMYSADQFGGLHIVIERHAASRNFVPRLFDAGYDLFRAAQLFRADRYDDAFAMMQARRRNSNIRATPEITILIPESIKYDDDAAGVVHVCLDTFRQGGRKKSLYKMPPSVIRSFAQLSECFWGKSEDQFDANECHDALSGFLTAANASGFNLQDLGTDCGWAMSTVLQRWEDRAIDPSFGQPQQREMS